MQPVLTRTGDRVCLSPVAPTFVRLFSRVALIIVSTSVAAAQERDPRVSPEDAGNGVDAPVVPDSKTDAPAATPVAEAPGAGDDANAPKAAPTATPTDGERPPPRDLDDELEGLDHEGTPPLPPREGEPDEVNDLPLAEDEDRPLPDYDGRAEPRTDARNVVRWVPRILFFPAYAVLEYGVRTPVVWTITRMEENHVTQRVSDALSWDEGRGTIHPMIYVDFGVRPNVGLQFRWKEFAPSHDVRVGAFTGFNDLWAGQFQLDQKLFRDEETLLRWSMGYVRRPDNVFYGFDPEDRCEDARQSNDFSERGCRYRSAIAEGRVALVTWERHLNSIRVGSTFRHARFSTTSDDPRLTSDEADSLVAFRSGYEIVQTDFAFSLDSRSEEVDFTRGTGVRFEGTGSFSFEPGSTERRWLRAGGELAGFYDIGQGQILSSSLYYEGIGNVSSRDSAGNQIGVPFHELVGLGGSEQMKSFLRRRLIGLNAWAANFEYRYPITWLLDAALYYSIGNTLDNLTDFDLRRSYMNYGVALKTSGNRVTAFEAIMGWGSNRLDEPDFIPFDQLRFTIGINRGF